MIQIEKIDAVDEVYPLIEPLFQAHHDEMSAHQDANVEPNVPLYRNAAEQGRLLCLIVWKDADVVGYSISFLTNGVHHRGVQFMTNDAIYVRPQDRKGRIGFRLFEATLTYARSMGARTMVFRSKPDTRWDRALPKIGCVLMEKTWGVDLA
jgi:GNAT superfamily N-acetyltransferase